MDSDSVVELRKFTKLVKSLEIQTLLNKLSHYKNSFIPVYISTADVFGHKFGPHSKELIKALKDIDSILKNFYHKCVKYHNGKCNISFLGDHGMEHVNTSINIKNIIDSISNDMSLKIGKDFYYFLDSTMVRVWWKLDNKEKLHIFHKKLLSNEVGTVASIIAKDIKIRKLVHHFQIRCAYHPPKKYNGS